jgi:hypothetical protein
VPGWWRTTNGDNSCGSLSRNATRPRSRGCSTTSCPTTGSNTPATASCARSPPTPRPRRRTRCWDGDDELADAIEVALGRRNTTLTPLDIDLELFADALTEPAGSTGYLDLHTGIVATEAMLDVGGEDEDTDLDDRSRWLPVAGEGSDEPYRDMQHYIATVTDPDLAGRLTDATDGRGAFRRFYDVIATAPAEHTRWQRYSDDARLGRARNWLADHGYHPAIQ